MAAAFLPARQPLRRLLFICLWLQGPRRASVSRISAAFQLLILTSADEVINFNVYPSHLHRNVTPEHYCLPSPRLAVAPCLFRSATLKRVRSETVSRGAA